ncbi:MAG: RHS repeat-associated core domain-containing protein [Bacteroidales bacterium]|nr:RHS repeat-associated core domain-containing protein [Bacteroidales bacterium]
MNKKYINNTLDTERNILHISDDEKRFAMIDTLTVENGEELDPYEVTIRYQYDNHLGSACLELDGSASIISYEEYHPFGTTSYRSGRSQTEVSLKRYKYCGKERDEETGLYYYGMRYYASCICRLVSVDPLQFKYPELTPFQYASNNPITMIDLDGKEGIHFSNVEKVKFNETNITYWKVTNLENQSNSRYQEINSVIQRMRESPAFNKLYNALSTMGDVHIDIQSNLIEDLGVGAAQAPSQNQGGVVIFKPINEYQPNTTNSVEFVAAEELFHQFQYIIYDITIENIINNTRTRTTMEIEAEAKLFVKLVMDELEIDLSQSGMLSYLGPLFYNENEISDISNLQDKEIKDELLDSYILYFNQFVSDIEAASKLNDKAHVYQSNIDKNEKVKIPDAFNELIKNK